jgi:fumarate reductase subunit D
LVKLGEGVLVFLFAVHLLGGVRLLLIENLPWFSGQRLLAVTAAGISAVAAFAFLATVF